MVFFDREELEERAKACCPEALWYELLDTLEEATDADLMALLDEFEGKDVSAEHADNWIDHMSQTTEQGNKRV